MDGQTRAMANADDGQTSTMGKRRRWQTPKMGKRRPWMGERGRWQTPTVGQRQRWMGKRRRGANADDGQTRANVLGENEPDLSDADYERVIGAPLADARHMLTCSKLATYVAYSKN